MTAISADPARIRSQPNIVAFIPDPHILFMVVAPTLVGTLAPMAACRAGACPCPAGKTQPIKTSETSSGGTPARPKADSMATEPNLGAETDAREP